MNIETTIFPQPSGGIRGIVIGVMTLNKKEVRVGHAYVMVEGEPQVMLKVPGNVPFGEIEALTLGLTQFREAVEKASKS